MQILDNEFFEAYKRLDRLCSDIYGCRQKTEDSQE